MNNKIDLQRKTYLFIYSLYKIARSRECTGKIQTTINQNFYVFLAVKTNSELQHGHVKRPAAR